MSLQFIEGKMRDEEEQNKRKIDKKRLNKLKENNMEEMIEK